MSYDAGSIQATLDLDRDPFDEVLDSAKADGQEFADSTFSAFLALNKDQYDADLDDARAEGDEFADNPLTANLRLDDSEYLADMEEAQAQGDEFDTSAFTGTLVGDDSGFLATLANSQSTAEALTDVPIVAHLIAEGSGVTTGVSAAEAQLEEFSAFGAVARLEADPLPAERSVEVATASVEEFGLLHATAKLSVDVAEGEAELAAFQASVAAVGGEDVGIGGAEDLGGIAAGLDSVEEAASGVTISLGQMITSSETAGLMFDSLDDLAGQLGLDLSLGSADVLEFGDALNIAIANQGASVEQLMDWFGQLPSAAGSAAGVIRGLSETMDTAGIDGNNLAASLDKVDASGDGAGKSLSGMGSSAASASSGMSSLLAATVLLGPALIPVLGVAAGALTGIAGAAVTGGLGLGAFAVAAEGDLSNVEAHAKSMLSAFQSLVAPDVIPVLNNSISLLQPAFTAAIPLVDSTSKALQGLEQEADSALNSPAWRDWTTFVDAEAGPSITALGNTIGNLGKGFAGLFEAFAPVESEMEQGLVSLTGDFDRWTSSTGGVHDFVNWFEQEGPQVGALFENLWQTSGHLLEGFGAWGAVLIEVANPLLQITNDILSINPVMSDLLAGLIIGGVAWKVWGDSISSVLSLPSKASESLLSSLSLNTEASEALAASETEGAAAAEADAAAQTELATASDAAAGSQGILADSVGASDVAGGGLLGTIGALVAVPLAATLAAWSIGSSISKNNTDQLNAAVAKMTATMSGAGATTIPQLNDAIAANNALIADLTNKQNGAGASTDNLTTKQHEALAVYTQSGVASGSYVASLQKIDAENKTLSGSINTQEDNLGLLNNKFGLSTSSAESLASALGINLNKALTGLQAEQIGAQFQALATKVDTTTSALENLHDISGQTLANIQSGMTAADNATASAFSSAGDAITAFSGQTAVTGQEVQLFYGSAVAQAQTFTANIRAAIVDGYDPTLISQLLQAGPAQAGPLLQALVDNASSGMVATVKAATTQLNSLNVEAVQEQKITYEAMTAGATLAGTQMASQVGKALGIQQQIAVANGTATAASVAQALGIGVAQVQQIAQEYGLALPTALEQQQVNAYLHAVAQGQQVPSGFLSLLSATQGAALQHANALPDAIQQQQVNTYLQALAQGQEVGTGITGAQPAASGAALSLANAVHGNLVIPDTYSLGLSAGQGLAAGIIASAQQGANAAAAAAESIMAAISNVVKPGSPSRATRDQFGIPIGQGLAVGMESTIPLVESTAKELANAAFSGLGTPSSAEEAALRAVQANGSNLTPAGTRTIQITQTNSFSGVSAADKATMQQVVNASNAELLRQLDAFEPVGS